LSQATSATTPKKQQPARSTSTGARAPADQNSVE
jgi:hypothetical protein